MDIRLIELFKVTLDDAPKVAFDTVNKEAMKRGYIVTEAACNRSVLNWLKATSADVNSTFYKEWKQVTSKTRTELFLDQILHYITTYGTNFESEFVYTCNDGQRPTFKFDKYRVIDVITPEDLLARCVKMLSGSALKQETMEAVADYVLANKADIDIDTIVNKEAMVYVCEKTGRVPSTAQGFLRYLVYIATGETLLIKNKATLERLINADSSKKKRCAKAIAALTEDQMVKMAGSFYRYKPLFLAFRHIVSAKTRKNINRIRQLARKHHKPVYAPADHAFDPSVPLEDVKKAIAGLTPFKKVSIWRSALMRLDSDGEDGHHVFVVRNGKVHLEKFYSSTQVDVERINAVIEIVRDSIVETVRNKKTGNGVVRLNDVVELALPTSEKNFIGDYPFGTRVAIADDNVFGIYWREAWGTRDFDLSMVDANGNSYSWCTNYHNGNGDVVYSGDMTYADPEAAECMYVRGSFIQKTGLGYLLCNQYSGSPNSKFKAFFARANKVPSHGAMVDPSTIQVQGEIKIAGRCTLFGVINEHYATLFGFNYGQARVGINVSDSREVMVELSRMAFCTPMLKDLLEAAGYTVVDSKYEGEVEYDFTDVNRDTLIDFIS